MAPCGIAESVPAHLNPRSRPFHKAKRWTGAGCFGCKNDVARDLLVKTRIQTLSYWSGILTRSKIINLLWLIAIPIVVAAAILWDTDGPKISDHWEYEVFATDLNKVDNIVVAPDQSLYVSLELPDGQGAVLHLESGVRTTILGGLRRADGLTLLSNTLVVTEEVEGGRVIKIDLENNHTEVIAELNKPEGVELLPGGLLAVSQDLVEDGNVVALDTDGRITLLAEGLDKPEGLATAEDGSLYVAESGTGRILNVSVDGTEIVLDGLNRPDQVEVALDGSIWVTEDRQSGRVMRFSDGELETILTGVIKPQGIAFDDAGWIYIAEQGRNRIIRLRRTS